MEACTFIVTDRLTDSYITTAALRRSGCVPEIDLRTENARAVENKPSMDKIRAQPDLHVWMMGKDQPHTNIM